MPMSSVKISYENHRNMMDPTATQTVEADLMKPCLTYTLAMPYNSAMKSEESANVFEAVPASKPQLKQQNSPNNRSPPNSRAMKSGSDYAQWMVNGEDNCVTDDSLSEYSSGYDASECDSFCQPLSPPTSRLTAQQDMPFQQNINDGFYIQQESEGLQPEAEHKPVSTYPVSTFAVQHPPVFQPSPVSSTQPTTILAFPPNNSCYPTWYPGNTMLPGNSGDIFTPYAAGKQYGSPAYPQASQQCGSLQQRQQQILQQQHPDQLQGDSFQLANVNRVARNRAEKHRRDKLNGSIHELAKMVPHVADSARRMDKTGVLRYAAHALRLNHVFGENIQKNSCPDVLVSTLSEMFNGFFLVATCSGQIVLLSSKVEDYLGYAQVDLYGQNILNFVHPEDVETFRHQLIPTNLDKLFETAAAANSENTENAEELNKQTIVESLSKDKRNFHIRLARAGPRTEPTIYELVRIEGSFLLSEAAQVSSSKNNKYPTALHLMRRSKCRGSTLPFQAAAIGSNDIVLTAFVHIEQPLQVLTRDVRSNMEYCTLHLTDGRIVDWDSRISTVSGYLGKEIAHMISFTFIHRDDAPFSIRALKRMYDLNLPYGESTYRLLTMDGRYVYMTTRGHLIIDEKTKQVRSFYATNILLDEEEGKRRLEEMRRLYPAITPSSSSIETRNESPAVTTEQWLEEEVKVLFEDLRAKDESDDSAEQTTLRITEIPNSPCSEQQDSPKNIGHVKVVPTESEATKSSINKAIQFICERISKPICDTANHDQTAAATTFEEPAVPVKRSMSQLEDEEYESLLQHAKRCRSGKDLEDILSNSLNNFERKLDSQRSEVTGLHDQTQLLGLPADEVQRFKELMQDHEKHSEYCVQLKSKLQQ